MYISTLTQTNIYPPLHSWGRGHGLYPLFKNHFFSSFCLFFSKVSLQIDGFCFVRNGTVHNVGGLCGQGGEGAPVDGQEYGEGAREKYLRTVIHQICQVPENIFCLNFFRPNTSVYFFVLTNAILFIRMALVSTENQAKVLDRNNLE